MMDTTEVVVVAAVPQVVALAEATADMGQDLPDPLDLQDGLSSTCVGCPTG